MIIDIRDTGGLIRLGNFSFLWQNPDPEFSGFTTFSLGQYALEFGDIDSGNGIFLTKYSNGDIEYTQPLLLL